MEDDDREACEWRELQDLLGRVDDIACEVLGHVWGPYEKWKTWTWKGCKRCHTHGYGTAPPLYEMLTYQVDKKISPAIVDYIFAPSPLLAMLKKSS